MLAVLALVASILVLPAPAAQADTAACPGTTPSAGFTDIGGFDHETTQSIDCLAFYGITKGTSATTFSPNDDVNRWQMALFLTRKLTTAGYTLGNGVGQGFTDIGSLSAATQTAINQLAQAGVTSGTSATTFSPNDTVSRWQMALFITRQLTAAGVALPSGAPQGFTDIGGLSSATQTAINQLAQLGISKGTTATTFDPTGNVNRWQMGLFLARDLNTLGVVPTTLRVSVTPSDTASQSVGGARAYTATFRNADGSLFSGFVGIQLLDATTAGAPIYNDAADLVTFESGSDGITAGGSEKNLFAGTDGTVTFIVRHAGAAEDIVPVAWIDLDSDSGYETTTNAPPTEPFGLGGVTKFLGAAAVEAAAGTYTGFDVDSVSNSFEAKKAATTCGNGAGVLCTFFNDSSDIYMIKGVVKTQAEFEAALSKTDVVTVVYKKKATKSDVSTFDITTDNTAASSLKVTTPSKATEIDSANFAVSGTGEPGWTVAVHNDANNDADTTGETKLAEGTIAGDGTWSLTVPLVQGAANNFVATQRKTAATAQPAAGTDVPTITEGPPAAAKIAASTWVDPGVLDGLNVGDVLTLNFTEAVKAPNSGDLIELVDSDGTRVSLTCGAQVTCVATDSDTITATVILFPVIVTTGSTAGLASPAQIDKLTGFEGTDGLAVNVSGSGATRLLTETL